MCFSSSYIMGLMAPSLPFDFWLIIGSGSQSATPFGGKNFHIIPVTQNLPPYTPTTGIHPLFFLHGCWRHMDFTVHPHTRCCTYSIQLLCLACSGCLRSVFVTFLFLNISAWISLAATDCIEITSHGNMTMFGITEKSLEELVHVCLFIIIRKKKICCALATSHFCVWHCI